MQHYAAQFSTVLTYSIKLNILEHTLTNSTQFSTPNNSNNTSQYNTFNTISRIKNILHTATQYKAIHHDSANVNTIQHHSATQCSIVILPKRIKQARPQAPLSANNSFITTIYRGCVSKPHVKWPAPKMNNDLNPLFPLFYFIFVGCLSGRCKAISTKSLQ